MDEELIDIEEEKPVEQGKSRNLDYLKPWQFKPGQSGNPAGRAKGNVSLKEYAKQMLASMTEEERQNFMKGLPKIEIWKMAEGTPDSKTDITSRGESLAPPSLSADLIAEIDAKLKEKKLNEQKT